MTTETEMTFSKTPQRIEHLHEVALTAAKYACSSIDKCGRGCREVAEDMADAYIGAMSRLIAASERIAISEAP